MYFSLIVFSGVLSGLAKGQGVIKYKGRNSLEGGRVVYRWKGFDVSFTNVKCLGHSEWTGCVLERARDWCGLGE